jgi:uncharacterized protein YdaL
MQARLVGVLALALLVPAVAFDARAAQAPPSSPDAPAPPTGRAAAERASGARPGGRSQAGVTTLILYDDDGPWGWLGELYAISAANLASHFGDSRALPVRAYWAGDLSRASAAIYIGSTPNAPLPKAFVEDVLAGPTPILWVAENVGQLAMRDGFVERFGFEAAGHEAEAVTHVRYKGAALTRDPLNDARLVRLRLVDGGSTRVVATAVTLSGAELPWAVSAAHLTYVAENPFTYTSETDRYLAFCDLLFDLLAPETPERHRALVRIEDVMPTDDPRRLRAIADALAAEGVPFSVAVIPLYVDARSSAAGPRAVRWIDVPATLAALEYMLAKGGVLVMHGYTHQRRSDPSPYDRVSGNDSEFWTAQLDEGRRLVLEGPVPEDSAGFATRRVRRGLRELARAGLPRPSIFEYPHYAGSAIDSRAIARIFPMAYHRGLYFHGLLSGKPPDPARAVTQLFPYEVTDVYGWRLVPENLGSFAPHAVGGIPARLAGDIIRAAEANRVVRDGFASFFFHSTHDPQVLVEIVRGIKKAGYAFVSPLSLDARAASLHEARSSRAIEGSE